MSMDSDFIRAFPPWKSGNKASAFAVCWWIIAGHLAEMFRGQNMAESEPLLLVYPNVCTLTIHTSSPVYVL